MQLSNCRTTGDSCAPTETPPTFEDRWQVLRWKTVRRSAPFTSLSMGSFPFLPLSIIVATPLKGEGRCSPLDCRLQCCDLRQRQAPLIRDELLLVSIGHMTMASCSLRCVLRCFFMLSARCTSWCSRDRCRGRAFLPYGSWSAVRL